MSKRNNGPKRRPEKRKAPGKGKLASRTAPAESSQHRHPKFSLRLLQSGYCVVNCTKDQRADFAETLRRLSQLTWGQINGDKRHGLGYEKINRLNVPIPPVAEGEKIIAFRFSDRAPMLGFRREATFYVLWIDPNLSTYNH